MHKVQFTSSHFLIKLAALFVVTLASSLPVCGQGKNVDNFKIKKQDVSVFFYDPLDSLIKLDKDFEAKSDQEKSGALDKYLHERPLYLFRLINSKTKEITFLCIRGDSAKVNTKMFYKLEVIKGEPADLNPNDNNYASNIVETTNGIDCGEHYLRI